ncbi:MAG: hypothetical protein KGJ23_08795 [Euryarchaeota archaeon]|nr:hypothetical protein [Euryarchaeota archaeon]MDE1836701.1 hypothetical protein [Euryarchaeota archaeon]MDE1880270.1 hypothetical protein [Euryarchaeota archaeon]MDE2044671.1 hypothetical protein [Thermoplasmata archaeon]
MNEGPVQMLPGVACCRHCGDPRHASEACPDALRVSEACPRCGSGTYVHRSGAICCVNANCDWVKGDPA